MMSNQITPECFKEGLILCDKERMKGHQGVSLDVLVGILPCLEKEMEEIVLHKTFKLAEKVASIMEEPEPFLSRSITKRWRAMVCTFGEGIDRWSSGAGKPAMFR
ncbi:hypothetical protein ACQ4PT_069285 [Festuca glaucescens]